MLICVIKVKSCMGVVESQSSLSVCCLLYFLLILKNIVKFCYTEFCLNEYLDNDVCKS